MLHRLYAFTLNLAAHRYAPWWLFAIAFIESSVFPIPPDVLLLPMILAQCQKAFIFAAICTMGSVLGGMFGYLIGYALLDTVAIPVLEFYGKMDAYYSFALMFQEWGWWLVFGAGLTPFPYKVITIASGAAMLDPAIFAVASIVGRGMRFFLVATLLWYWGEPIKRFIEKYLALLTTLFFVLLIGGFVALKYV